MDAERLFQLGMDLETSGTAQTEDILDWDADAVSRKTNSDTETDADALKGNTEQDHFICKDGVVYAGEHLILDVVDGEGLDDQARIEQALLDCVEECGATLLHIHLHKFSPQGVSGVAVLAESHISVHTWPERGYGAFDVFMCGDAEPRKAIGVLRRAFNARDVRVHTLKRGDGIVG